jgi:hypothetical protein
LRKKQDRGISRKNHKRKSKWACVDCKSDTKLEHYFVHNTVWSAAGMSEVGMLCIGCLESRLGRTLNRNDFTSAHINNYRKNAMSLRLVERLKTEG